MTSVILVHLDEVDESLRGLRKRPGQAAPYYGDIPDEFSRPMGNHRETIVKMEVLARPGAPQLGHLWRPRLIAHGELNAGILLHVYHRPSNAVVYARHGRELVGCKSPVSESGHR